MRIPLIQDPIIFDIKSRPRSVPVTTGSKGNNMFVLYLVNPFFVTKSKLWSILKHLLLMASSGRSPDSESDTSYFVPSRPYSPAKHLH